MATILILGAGVMGSALAVPATDNGHTVLLAGTPLDAAIIDRLKQWGGIHPELDAPLFDAVQVIAGGELTPAHVEAADLVVVGVSNPGIEWVADRLNGLLVSEIPIAFVTKGWTEMAAAWSPMPRPCRAASRGCRLSLASAVPVSRKSCPTAFRPSAFILAVTARRRSERWN